MGWTPRVTRFSVEGGSVATSCERPGFPAHSHCTSHSPLAPLPHHGLQLPLTSMNRLLRARSVGSLGSLEDWRDGDAKYSKLHKSRQGRLSRLPSCAPLLLVAVLVVCAFFAAQVRPRGAVAPWPRLAATPEARPGPRSTHQWPGRRPPPQSVAPRLPSTKALPELDEQPRISRVRRAAAALGCTVLKSRCLNWVLVAVSEGRRGRRRPACAARLQVALENMQQYAVLADQGAAADGSGELGGKPQQQRRQQQEQQQQQRAAGRSEPRPTGEQQQGGDVQQEQLLRDTAGLGAGGVHALPRRRQRRKTKYTPSLKQDVDDLILEAAEGALAAGWDPSMQRPAQAVRAGLCAQMWSLVRRCRGLCRGCSVLTQSTQPCQLRMTGPERAAVVPPCLWQLPRCTAS